MAICGRIGRCISNRQILASDGCHRNPKKNPRKTHGTSPIYSRQEGFSHRRFHSLLFLRYLHPSNEVLAMGKEKIHISIVVIGHVDSGNLISLNNLRATHDSSISLILICCASFALS